MTLSSTAIPLVESRVTASDARHDNPPRRRMGRMFGTMALATSYAFITPAISAVPSETAVSLVEPWGTGQQLNTDRADLAVIARIRELGTYPAGWNRPGSVAPTKATVEDAEQFARKLNLHAIHLPHISAADDGEINFWWDMDGLYIDLGFFGDGVYSFYARLPNGEEMIADDAPVSQPLPAEILRYLEKAA